MKINLKYMELYRKLETVLRESGTDYKTLEDGADEFKQGRLRICRQMRNYMTHRKDDGFLEISDKQIAFLEEEIKRVQEMGDVLKKHLKTVKTSCCMKEDFIGDVFLKMIRLSLFYIPVIDENKVGAGILTIHEAIKTYTSSAKPKTSKVKNISKLIELKDEVCFDPMAKIEDVPGQNEFGFVLCTENGEKNGKVIGVHIIK